MHINDIGYFLAILEHRSLQRAAAAVGLTQPALTKCVHRLEEALGTKLFERGPGGTVPTRAALTFADHARRLDTEYTAAMRTLGDLAAGEAAVVRIGATPTWEFLAGQALLDFLPHRPATRLKLSIMFSDKLLDALGRGDIDLALATAPRVGTGFDALRLSDEEMQPIARARHPLFHLGRDVRVDDFVGTAWAVPRAGVSSRDQLDAAFAARGLPSITVQVELDGSGALGSFPLLARCDLIGLCPGALLPSAAAIGLLPFGVDALRLSTFPTLVTRKDAAQAPVVAAFIASLAASARPMRAPSD